MSTSKNTNIFFRSPSLKFNAVAFMLFQLLLISVSCNKGDDAAPASTCKLSSYTTSGDGKDAGKTYTYTNTANFTYDDKGNLTGSSNSYKSSYSDATTSIGNSTTSYQYDDKGFVLKSISQGSTTDRAGKQSTSGYSQEYEYEQGRLTKYSYVSTSGGVSNSYSFSYQYDGDGKLIKYSNTYDNSYTKFEYSGKQVQKITTVDKNGNTSSPLLQYDSKGLLVKAVETSSGYTEESRYEYNESGEQTRYERYVNGKPYAATTYEYDQKEYVYQRIFGPYKGHPMIPSARPDFVRKHNFSSLRYFNASPEGQWQLSSSTDYIHDYNARNFPVSEIAKDLDKNGVQISSSNTTFTFQDCD